MRKNLSGTAYLLVIVAVYILNIVITAFLGGSQWSTWLRSIILQFLLIVLLLILTKYSRYDLVQEGNFRRSVSLSGVICSVFTVLGAYIAGIGLSNLLFYIFELLGYATQGSMPTMTGAFTLGLTLFSSAFMPAIGEEFIFRGTILPSLRKSYGTSKAILFTALAFALLHGNVMQIGYQFLLALIMCLFVLGGRSIWYGVIVHFLNNAITIVISYINKMQGGVINQPTANQYFASTDWLLHLGFLIVGLALAYFGCKLFLYFARNKIDKKGKLFSSKMVDSIEELHPTKEDGEVLENKKENIFFWTGVIICLAFVALDFISKVVKY